ncbi:MAG: ABC transporter permease [candidate division SR1 bacterium]|nr:ABC transporter permease [candidate division SR1 bacterium]
MQIKEHIQNAVTDLSRNKLRTGLSMLGIIIGVVSVVVLLAIGNGTQKNIVNQIQSLGTNLLTISPGGRNQSLRGGGGAAGTTATLDADMIQYIQKNISNIGTIAPSVNGRQSVVYSTFNTSTTVNGVTPEYLTVRNLKVQNGSFITNDDIDNLTKIAVLGNAMAGDIFGSGAFAVDPIGKTIKMGNVVMTVVGVLAANATADDAIFIPLTTAQTRILGSRNYSSISISAIDTTIVDQTKTDLETSLKTYLGLKPTATANFTVQSQSDMITTVSSITGMLTALLAGIAAISLLVGGIGVMNIMLVSVTERIKEIGIRKAIGAHRKDILMQFLTESVTLSLMGGLIGIALSFMIVFVINKLMMAIISLDAVLLAFFSAVSIGIVFGILPANNAAKLKPIEALRYE